MGSDNRGKAPPAQAPSGGGWVVSVLLTYLLGAFGAFFTIKEFGDPGFSDWISPGPGQMFVGDAGRMLMFEAGDKGVQSKLLGVPAWLIEGLLLGAGTVGVLLSASKAPLAQLLSSLLVPIQACYYLVNVAYFPLTGAPELALPMEV
ncbi:hypothetical protein T484DRAFT_1812383 [Baffinella frigidus]|nr:hypothetical protein T484DRAFT_1812383 [Cryptophyta sp. CCMP2293]